MDNPKKCHRRSIRLPGYDYQTAGAYFVTLCTQNRLCLFGDIANGEMILNGSGYMVHRVWNELPQFYPGVNIDAFQIMPNHVHGIIILVGATPCGCPDMAPPHDSTPTTPFVGAGPRACPPPHAGQPQDGQPRWVGQARGPAPTGLAGGG